MSPTASPRSASPATRDDATVTRGHKKKARTRALLLDTATEMLAEQGEGFSVADLAGRAGVSHGTFYNYFADRDQLIEALVPHVVEQFAQRMADEVTHTDPAARFAHISARALEIARTEPKAIRVALRLDAVQRELLVAGPLAHLRTDLADGFAAGRFTCPPDDATLDVVVGALLFAARRIAEGETGSDYRRSIIARLLEMLGLAAEEAADLAEAAVVP